MRSVAAGLFLLITLTAGAQTAAAPHATYYRLGAATDAKAHPRAGYALMGGGKDLDDAFHWLCERADGGDFVVLRASGDDAYNPYINELCKLNSITTVVIPDRDAAMEPRAAETIRAAEAIFIAGGDQAKYIRFWRGTPVEAALRDAVQRGIPMGGTSAGLAVMGEFIYSAEGDKPDDPDLTSEAAMADPFYRQVVITPDLLGIPILRGIITDTHFDTRKREGRLLTFMARILKSGETRIRGIGVDERTALLVEPDGNARVVGKSEVDFFEASQKPDVCEAGKPLRFSGIREERIPSGGNFDLKSWHGGDRIYTVQVLASATGPVIATTPAEFDSPSAEK